MAYHSGQVVTCQVKVGSFVHFRSLKSALDLTVQNKNIIRVKEYDTYVPCDAYLSYDAKNNNPR
jgi:hypothetical protein